MGELAVTNVSKTHLVKNGWRAPQKLAVFSSLSFTLKNGEFVSLIGPSGCGKTTVLNLVAGLDRSYEGQILIDGKLVTGSGLDRGVVFQDFGLFPWLTVEQNVAFGLRSMHVDRAQRDRLTSHFIQLVGLQGFEGYYPNRLSGGMKQRVGLARALAIDPAVLLMDEPFGALDAQTREMLQSALNDIWTRRRKTILFITHDIEEAVFLSDRVLVLGGRPSKITTDLIIDLPRVRDRRSVEFQSYEKQLSDAIRRSSALADATGEIPIKRLAASEIPASNAVTADSRGIR